MILQNLKISTSVPAHVMLGQAVLKLRIPVRGFCILAQGRTGSTLLADLLNSHPEIVCDGEILARPNKFAELFVMGRAARFSRGNKLWGFKVKHYHITSCFSSKEGNFLEKLHHKRWKIIWLRRENFVKLALSTIVGMERGRFVYSKDEVDDYPPIFIKPEEFRAHLRGRVDQLRRDRAMISGLPHYEMIYERDLSEINGGCDLAELAEFLGVSMLPMKTNVRKTDSRPVREFVSNWSELYDLACSEGFKKMADSVK